MFFSIVATLGVIVSVALVTFALRLLIKSKWFLGWLRGTGGLLLILVAVLLTMFAWDLHTYKSFTKEQDIGTISFTRTATQQYTVNLSLTGGESHHYEMHGDLWQVDARIVRWKSWIEKMGVSPGYRLDRLSSRYFDIEDERAKLNSVYSLFKPDIKFIDIWQLSSEHPALVPFVDSRYGSGTYLPMRDGALFSIRLTNSGLIARPLNDSAKTAITSW